MSGSLNLIEMGIFFHWAVAEMDGPILDCKFARFRLLGKIMRVQFIFNSPRKYNVHSKRTPSHAFEDAGNCKITPNRFNQFLVELRRRHGRKLLENFLLY